MEKQNRYKKLVLNTIIFALGSFGAKIISFFLIPLYTNVLSPAQYGISELAFTFCTLLMPLISLSIGESVLFYGLKTDDENQKEKILKNAFLIIVLGSFALLLFSPLFLFYESLKQYIWFIVAYTVAYAFRMSMQFYTKARNKNVVFALESIINAFLIAVLNILFLVVLKIGLIGYFLALAVSEIGSTLFLIIYNKGIKIALVVKIDKKMLKEMLKYSLPLILNSISWAIFHSTDKLMLRAFISEDAVGLYSVASKIPTLVNTLAMFFCQAWTLSSIVEFEKKDRIFYSKVYLAFNFILCISVFTILCFLKPFMKIYVGSDFIDSWIYVPFLLIACMFPNYSSFFGSIIQSGKKNTVLMISSIVGATINVLLNWILIIKIGVQGAVFATLFSYIVTTIMRVYFSQKMFKININYLATIGSILILCVFSAFLVYSNVSIRMMIAFGLILIIFNLDGIKMFWSLLNKLIKNKIFRRKEEKR